jgi:hypothetical protein
MSDIWARALEGFVQQMRDHGYSGFPNVASGAGAIYGLINAVKDF